MDSFDALRIATEAGSRSPCAKSKRGVVIWNHTGVLSTGFNGPPRTFVCDGSDACRDSCGKIAVHAEQAAILAAPRYSLHGAEMLHVKVHHVADRWIHVFGGPPSCPDCSKLILEAGIGGMWLCEEQDGRPVVVRYTAIEFHLYTLRNKGLHIAQK